MKICPRCHGSFEEGIVYCPKDGSRLTSLSKMTLAGGPPPEAVAHDEVFEDLTGQTIAGRYRILRRLGEGGMGVVYAAVDDRLEKEVAIKVLKEDFARRSDVVARFTQEAKSAARIKHENVLDVTDYGQTEAGSFYIAMEMLVGTDLADLLQAHTTIEPQRAVAISIQIARALAAAHAKGIVHRDLKPENVFLVQADDGREVVKIVDFGIAQMKDLSGGAGADSGRKLTRTGMIFGTPEYMSPEQAAGKPIDHRVDVYAAGVILYEMLAGRVPFVGDTFMGVLTQHMFEAPPSIRALRPDAVVPPDLEVVIAKALSKDPAQRYQSMQELADDLIAFRDGRRPAAAGASQTLPAPKGAGAPASTVALAEGDTLPPGRPEAASRRTLVLAGILGALVLAGGALGIARTMGGARRVGGGPEGVTTANASGVASAGDTRATTAADAAAQGSAEVVIPSTAVDAGVVAAPSTVRVRILTAPVSGSVEVEGHAALSCAATPCELELPRGAEVRLRATAPRKRGELAFVPEQPGQQVTVPLRAVSTGGASGSHGGASAGGNANANNAANNSNNSNNNNRRCRPGQQFYIVPGTTLRQPCAFVGAP